MWGWDVGGQSAVRCEAQPGQQRSPSFSSGDFQEWGISVCTGSAATYPGARGGTGEFRSLSREPGGPGRLLGGGPGGRARQGKGRVSSPGWAGGRSADAEAGPAGLPWLKPLWIWEPREPWDRVSPLSGHTLGCFPKGSRRKEGLPALAPAGGEACPGEGLGPLRVNLDPAASKLRDPGQAGALTSLSDSVFPCAMWIKNKTPKPEQTSFLCSPLPLRVAERIMQDK